MKTKVKKVRVLSAFEGLGGEEIIADVEVTTQTIETPEPGMIKADSIPKECKIIKTETYII